MQNAPESSENLRTLNRGTLALHANTVIGAGFGFLFMILAANLYDEERLGRDMAMIQAIMLLAAAAELNLSMALARFLPQLGKRSSRVVLLSYAASTAVALILATAFVVVVPLVSESLAFVTESFTLALIFVGSVVLWNVFALNDAVLAAVRRATWIPFENGLFSLLKVVLMVAFAAAAYEYGVFFSWAIPMAVMVLPMTMLLFRIALRRHAAATPQTIEPEHEVLTGRRQIFRYLGLDYVASVISQAGTSVLPLLVVVMLGVEANASFAIAFSIAVALEQFALNSGLVLTVEGSFDRATLARLTRHTFVRWGGLLLVAVTVAVAATPLLLWPFGGDYSETASTVLRLLLIGTLPQAFVILYESVARVEGKAGRILFTTFAQMVTTIAFAVILSKSLGLAGFGWGWLIGHSVVALAVAPSLFRVMFPRTARS